MGGRIRSAASPRTQSLSVSPSGADQSADPSLRTHMSWASSAYLAHASRGSGPSVGGRVRPGSIRDQTCCRDDSQPVGRPPRSGEFANAATSTGPIACSSRHRWR